MKGDRLQLAPDDGRYGRCFHRGPCIHALIDAAHALGLKVLMDFVPNHASERHRYYLDSQRDGARSAYHRWFEHDEEGEATNYFDWECRERLQS